MKEGNQFASPVFKKRFARRKTTQRPFTFARNFEAEEPLAGAKSPIVSQVGDRGVVITSPVQLPRSNEKLTISEIVRQSPVPVLIAHSTPRKDEREQTSDDDNDDEDANTSLLRRSGRSRVPSEQFLSRRQHPHGTPQLPKPQPKPDESYIGSQNSSNIDAEVSIVDEDGQTRGGRRGISASFSRSSKQTPKAKTVEKSSEPASSARGKTQTGGDDQSEGNRSGAKDGSTKKGSSRRVTSASAKTSSNRKGRGRAVQDRTASPQPSAQKQKRNLSHSVAPSPLSKRKKDENGVDSSSSKKVATKNKTPPSSSLKGKKAGSISTSSRTSKSLKKRTPQSDVDKERSESASVRSVDKTLSEKENRSYSSEYEDPISLQADSDLSVLGSSETHSNSPTIGNKQDLPQTEKENRPVPKNKEATSPTPSTRRKQNKTMDSSSKGESTLMLRSSRKDRSNSELLASSSSSKHTRQSQEENRVTSSSAKKRKKAVADESVHSNVSERLSPIREDESRNRSTRNSGKGNKSDLQVKGKSEKDPEPMKTASSAGRKKKMTPVEENVETLGPSPKKRARNSHVQDTEADSAQDESQRQKSLPSSSLSRIQSGREKSSVLSMPDMQSTKKNKRENSQSKNHSENGSLANSRVSEGGLTNYASTSRTKEFDPQTSVPNSSHERISSTVHKSPRKTVASKDVGERSSPRMSQRKAKSANSFWKPSRQMGSSVKSRRQQPALSQSSLYDNQSLGGGEVGSSVVVSHQVPGKRSTTASRDYRKSKPSQGEEEEPKRPRPVVTELEVIISMLEDAEEDIMEESAMSELCQKAVHKAFIFTKQQLQETESQLKDISEVEYQINKLKSSCKAMSSESKEKLQQKFILQKELQSLKTQGIDADMMRIDQWLQDFQALRLCNN